MKTIDRRTAIGMGLGFVSLIGAQAIGAPMAVAETIPREIGDDALWRMVSGFSEEGGSFRFEYMSNEREFQWVIPSLKQGTKPGGVYLGVGPEQNFTYIAAIQPKIAFIFDIRRQNMLEHLIYKAVFEMSADRSDFVSRLFSRKVPAGLSVSGSAKELFNAYRSAPPDMPLFARNLQTIQDRLTGVHRFQLSAMDKADIEDIYRTFFSAGVGPPSAAGFRGGGNANYADLMTATDTMGQERSYLATEKNFQFVQDMERKNLIVPLVGDFAGSKAIRAVAKYLKDNGAIVTAFYTSNVEQYLFQQDDDWRHYYSNVGTLPLDSSSTFIRSAHFAYEGNQRTGQTSGGNFLSLLCPMKALINAFDDGRIRDYDGVIQLSRYPK